MTKAMIVDLKQQKMSVMTADMATSTSQLNNCSMMMDSCAQTDSVSISDGGCIAEDGRVSSNSGSVSELAIMKQKQQPSSGEPPCPPVQSRATTRTHSKTSSFSRLFSFRRRPEAATATSSSPAIASPTHMSVGQRAVALEDSRRLPVEQWRADHVAAWLETQLGSGLVAGQVKSGSLLLRLSEADMTRELGLVEPLHRRRLRLAIDELATGQEAIPAAALDTNWVCERLLPWCGLPQYRGLAAAARLDGRLLASGLSRRDLQRHLGLTCRRHVASLLHAVELLRRLNFDVAALAARRRVAEEADVDALVWSNQRLAQWLADHDLHEYLGGFAESGLHGAYLCLEPGFGADTLAGMLAVPKSAILVRRHLADAFERCIRPARWGTFDVACHLHSCCRVIVVSG